MNKKGVVAIITARGGSKGLPGKNTSLLAGKPLIAYTIEAALCCKLIQRCIVSTDDPKIKKVSLRYGAEVIERPRKLASDHARSEDVVRHVLLSLRKKGCHPEYFVLLQPTSPLRTAQHITACLKQLLKCKSACSISLTETESHPYKTLIVRNRKMLPIVDFASLDKPRQLLPKAYRPNGAIYIMRSDTFLKKRSFFTKNFLPFFMRAEESIDIDSKLDLLIADTLTCKIK